MKLVFDKAFPKDLEKDFRLYMKKYEQRLPSWSKKFSFIWVPVSLEDNEDTLLRIEMQKEYKSSNIYAYPIILSRDDKESIFLHELCHTYTGPLFSYIHNLIQILLPAPDHEQFQQHLLEELRLLNESCTEDLTDVIEEMTQEIELLKSKTDKTRKRVAKK